MKELREREQHERVPGKYYPSKIGNECLRQSFFHFAIPKRPEEDTMRIFEQGNVLHEYLSKKLKQLENYDFVGEEIPMMLTLVKEKEKNSKKQNGNKKCFIFSLFSNQ